MKYIVTLNQKDYEVEVSGGNATLAEGKSEPKAAPAQAPKAASAPESKAAPVAGSVVSAPMPGSIVRILVAAGDKVKAHQPLLVLEAMKMENEIVAPVDGTVAEVSTAPGASVSTGDRLLVLA